MVACDMRVARKKLFAIFKNINPGKGNSDEANTEKIRSGKTESACEGTTAKRVLING
jgi:hypothetical protein